LAPELVSSGFFETRGSNLSNFFNIELADPDNMGGGVATPDS
jgi:hypothetical protein